jgi:hypothetical protein
MASDVVHTINGSADNKRGTVTVMTSPKANFQKYEELNISDGASDTALEARLTERFDDPSYYHGS